MIRVSTDLAEVWIVDCVVDAIPNIDEQQYQHILRHLKQDALAIAAALTAMSGTKFTFKGVI